MRTRLKHSSALAAVCMTAGATSVALASAPPVGPLPAGHVSSIQTVAGDLVAVALPHRTGGKVWRIARAFDPSVVVEDGEADVGSNVVVVFRAEGRGTTKLVFALTRGERAKAYESRAFVVRVG